MKKEREGGGVKQTTEEVKPKPKPPSNYDFNFAKQPETHPKKGNSYLKVLEFIVLY